jgi:hypothetical protein
MIVHTQERAMSDERPVNRGEFLRWAALGAGGLGLSALAGCTTKHVAEGERKGHVVAVTHGPEDSTRVMLALLIASKLPKGDNHVWFAIDGGQLCKKGDAEKVTSPLFVKQGNAAKLLESIRANGTAAHI